MEAQKRRRRLSHTAGRWPSAWGSFALALATVLSPMAAGAETASSPASFDARFAAVDVSGNAQDRATSAVAQKENGSETARGEAPQSSPDARSRYRILIEKEASRAGLAPEIAEAVMAVESGYNAGAIGGVGEIGLMQILPSTARMLGFNGTQAELAVPETNIRYGVMYLAQAWRLAGGDLCTAVMKYRAGHGETRFSFLSVKYCLAVRSNLAARGYRVTGDVPIATFGRPDQPGRGCGRKCLDVSRIGTVNIVALNTRLSALVMQARGGR